jgi:rubrerythrin
MTTATAIASTSQTLANLQAAYEGESNATVKYTAFAIKAEVEGYLRAATLFRAAARAEQVHAAHHARIIKKLGGTPTAIIHPPEVNGTRENLEAAKAGEEYERDVMYPDFVNQAQAAGQKEAVRSFDLAMKAEAVHAKLYGAALADLEGQKVATIFYVCLICGEVTDKPEDTEHCPICGAVKEKFIAVR